MAQIFARDLVYDGWNKFYRSEVGFADGGGGEPHLLCNGSAVGALPYHPVRWVAEDGGAEGEQVSSPSTRCRWTICARWCWTGG
ncbi:hypothetical protein [Novosphingobium ovatum]|uniref:hypothetical protein n=1 Tax=Novosphingobium ovatum TaxID=1908523 RepID=UPI001D11A41F|nr:hypothetical protein [Novosphingobium ovatum]